MDKLQPWMIRRSISGIEFGNLKEFFDADVGNTLDQLQTHIPIDKRLDAYLTAATANVIFNLRRSHLQHDKPMQALVKKFGSRHLAKLIQLAAFFANYECDGLTRCEALTLCLHTGMRYLDPKKLALICAPNSPIWMIVDDALLLSKIGDKKHFNLGHMTSINQLPSKSRTRRLSVMTSLYHCALAIRHFKMRYAMTRKATDIQLTILDARHKRTYEVPALAPATLSKQDLKKRHPEFFKDDRPVITEHYRDFLAAFRSHSQLDRYSCHPDDYYTEITLTAPTLSEDIHSLPFSNLKLQLIAVDETSQFALEQTAKGDEAHEKMTAFREDTHQFVKACQAGKAADGVTDYLNQYEERFGKVQQQTVANGFERLVYGVCTAAVGFVIGATIGFTVGFCLGAWTGPGAALTSVSCALFTGTEFAACALGWSVIGVTAVTTALAAAAPKPIQKALSVREKGLFHQREDAYLPKQLKSIEQATMA